MVRFKSSSREDVWLNCELLPASHPQYTKTIVTVVQHTHYSYISFTQY